MSTSAAKPTVALASKVWFDSAMLHVRLADGREIAVPLEWFPRLRDATEEDRKRWRLVGGGIGIHWEALDEDISIVGLLS